MLTMFWRGVILGATEGLKAGLGFLWLSVFLATILGSGSVHSWKSSLVAMETPTLISSFSSSSNLDQSNKSNFLQHKGFYLPCLLSVDFLGKSSCSKLLIGTFKESSCSLRAPANSWSFSSCASLFFCTCRFLAVKSLHIFTWLTTTPRTRTRTLH